VVEVTPVFQELAPVVSAEIQGTFLIPIGIFDRPYLKKSALEMPETFVLREIMSYCRFQGGLLFRLGFFFTLGKVWKLRIFGLGNKNVWFGKTHIRRKKSNKTFFPNLKNLNSQTFSQSEKKITKK
jgi:hypothetical protein